MSKEVLDHWNDPDVESMYDKSLLSLETRLIHRALPVNGLILDAGMGEGEGTAVYSTIEGSFVIGLDNSPTRLELAKKNLAGRQNVELVQASVTELPFPDDTFGAVITQRCLINLLTDDERERAISELVRVCKLGCSIICLEGSVEGHEGLNHARSKFGLPPIDVRFHNRFFTGPEIVKLFSDAGAELEYSVGLGGFLYLTRVLRPAVIAETVGAGTLSWDCDFNVIAADENSLVKRPDCDRLKMWVFEKTYCNWLD